MVRQALIFISCFFFMNTPCFAMDLWPFHWFKAADSCLNQGNTQWNGTGKLTGIINCHYAGEGSVLGNAPDYQLMVHLTKSGGTFLCPHTYDLTLNLSCISGKITVRQPNIALDGQIVGNYITIEGVITVIGIKNHVYLTATRK